MTPNVDLRNQAERDKYDLFWNNVFYAQGFYDESESYKDMLTQLEALEKGKSITNRLYYLALPPDIYANTSATIHDVGMVSKLIAIDAIDLSFLLSIFIFVFFFF